MKSTILHGDNRKILDDIKEKSITCVVTSPPYFNCRTYGEDINEIGREESPLKFINNLMIVMSKIKRVLTDDGVVWINLGDSIAKKNWPCEGDIVAIKKGEQMMIPSIFALRCRKEGWFVQQDVIWAKTNPMPSSTPKRCTPSHEYIFMLTKTEDYKFYPDRIVTAAKSDLSKSSTKPKFGGNKQAGGDNATYSGKEYNYTGTARKRDVWIETTSKNPDAHFAPFPRTIVEPCILASSDEGDIVLDPFSGSGTTGVVSVDLKRNFIGIELYENYVQMANKKLKKDE